MSTIDHVRRYRTTPELIADALRDEISRGAVADGDALPQEALATRFGVSRLPVREALLRLEAEGLVVVYPNRGAVVAALTVEEVREIYDLRLLLEPDLLARAVPHMRRAELTEIESACDAAERAVSGPDWSARDRDFHLALYEPARRERQSAMVAALRGTVGRYAAAHAHLPSRTADWLADHRAILACCQAGDVAGAKAALAGHITRAGALVLDRLAQVGR